MRVCLWLGGRMFSSNRRDLHSQSAERAEGDDQRQTLFRTLRLRHHARLSTQTVAYSPTRSVVDP